MLFFILRNVRARASLKNKCSQLNPRVINTSIPTIIHSSNSYTISIQTAPKTVKIQHRNGVYPLLIGTDIYTETASKRQSAFNSRWRRLSVGRLSKIVPFLLNSSKIRKTRTSSPSKSLPDMDPGKSSIMDYEYLSSEHLTGFDSYKVNFQLYIYIFICDDCYVCLYLTVIQYDARSGI